MGFLRCQQEFAGERPQVRFADLKRLLDAGNFERSDQMTMVGNKLFDVGSCCRFANEIGHVDGKEVGRRDEAIDIAEIDVVGIDEILAIVTQRLDSGIGRTAGICGFGMDDVVFAVGFVPDRRDRNTEFLPGLEGRRQLRLALM